MYIYILYIYTLMYIYIYIYTCSYKGCNGSMLFSIYKHTTNNTHTGLYVCVSIMFVCVRHKKNSETPHWIYICTRMEVAFTHSYTWVLHAHAKFVNLLNMYVWGENLLLAHSEERHGTQSRSAEQVRKLRAHTQTIHMCVRMYGRVGFMHQTISNVMSESEIC